jgi:hypothetical protein
MRNILFIWAACVGVRGHHVNRKTLLQTMLQNDYNNYQWLLIVNTNQLR